MNTLAKIIAGFVVMLIVAGIFCGFLLLCGFAFQFLWNFVIPLAFHGPILGYWQSVAIVMLLSIVGSLLNSSVSRK